MGQSHSSEMVEDGQEFVVSTKASLIKRDDGKDNKDAMYGYLTGTAFKKWATRTLNDNYAEDKNIKIVVKSIDVSKSLAVKIKGNVQVSKKGDGEMLNLLEDSLKTSLSHASGAGESIPSSKGLYRIQFKESDTKVEFS